MFRYIQKNGLARSFLFDILKVNGATAQGMINPNSKTNALGEFKSRIERMGPWQEVFFQLGEVDCGFVIWYYSEKNGTSLDEQFQRSIDNYVSMLEWTEEIGIRRVTILSAPLPTISDGQTWGDIANARSAVQATQHERTALTLRYNKEMMDVACRMGLSYIDITTPLLNTENRLVDDRFLNPNPLDHHLSSPQYAGVVTRALENSSPPSPHAET